MNNIKTQAEQILHEFIGKDKSFRSGQYEAIEATLTNKRTLVVQRTGWGKSMVYFICAKLLRNQKKGITIIISPLISLMNNQIASAEKIGLRCDVLNSTKNDEQRKQIIEDMKNDTIDIVFTTPETLFKKFLQEALPKINIGLFVVDEAHCISDWGHDFRLEYSRLNKVIKAIPTNVPLLATTATANNRVINDLKKQFGENIYISRGALMRDNLSIQVLKLNNKIERYAWLYENIPNFSGSGIVYCLTHDDCDEIANFLNINGISARAYYSDSKTEEYNYETERLFMNNSIKVIVATVKLGMGYDKPDIAFVIHYQSPANIVTYYQQIGRAGRNIDRAYTFLMNGAEDKHIFEYFKNTAFPTEDEYNLVYSFIVKEKNVKWSSIIGSLNIPYERIKKTLKFLINDNLIYKDDSNNCYYPSTIPYHYNKEHYKQITEQRNIEHNKMFELINTDICYNRFIVNALDDKTEENCNICANCLGHEEFSSKVSQDSLEKATKYLENRFINIEPRLKWESTPFTKKTKIKHPNEQGICLSRYGQPIYGELVKKGKYSDRGFCTQLVEKSVQVLLPFILEHKISALTYVPSSNSNIVYEFANKLATKLGIPCLNLLIKTRLDSPQQKQMENSCFQCKNAQESFGFKKGEENNIHNCILLIDDMVDSRWTLTVCGDILIRAGVHHVYPFTLATTSKRDDLYER